MRKGQLLVKLGPYHAEPHEAEATPEANNVRTETPYPYLPPKVELVIFPANGGVGGATPTPLRRPFWGRRPPAPRGRRHHYLKSVSRPAGQVLDLALLAARSK